MEFNIKQIGVIHTNYKTKDECPIQSKIAIKSQGQVEIYPEYEEGLHTIEMFSHIVLFYIFDKAGEIKLVRPTFLDDDSHGVFASRHPCRPNGIGTSVVKLIKRDKNILYVEGIDILDCTPLIDIKPYVPKFDRFEDANNGWVESKEFRDKPPGRE